MECHWFSGQIAHVPITDKDRSALNAGYCAQLQLEQSQSGQVNAGASGSTTVPVPLADIASLCVDDAGTNSVYGNRSMPDGGAFSTLISRTSTVKVAVTYKSESQSAEMGDNMGNTNSLGGCADLGSAAAVHVFELYNPSSTAQGNLLSDHHSGQLSGSACDPK